ncbi:hypothetical protein [Fibrella aestuarina]|nr:hypothetical protein [Fibrella aestuarina]
MDPKLAAESQEIHQKARMKAQGTPKPVANSGAAAEAPTLTEFQKEYRRNLNQPLTQTPFEKAMAALERRYPVDEVYVSPITYEEASKLFKTIMRGELARIGRTPYYTAADSVVIKGLLLWLLRDRTSPYDLHRGIFLHGQPGLGKSLIFRALKILAANVPLPDRLFNMASTKGLLGDISITKEFGSLTRYKSGCWLLDDLMDEKDGESAAYAERMDVLDWLLTERAKVFVEKGLFTLFTSNKGKDDIELHYGTRIADRFEELVTFVELTGATKRPVQTGVPSPTNATPESNEGNNDANLTLNS